MKIQATIALLCCVSGAAMANDTTTCTMKGATRTVEVVSAGKGCQVMYTKGKEATKALWTYEHQADQCGEKAKGFTDKLAAAGWTCSAGAAAAPAAAPAAAAPAAAPAAPAKK